MKDRFNTIAGWVLGGGIVLLGATLVTGEIFHAERPEKMGYPIAGVEAEGEGGGEAEQPIAVALQTADVARGEAVFRKCAACHTVNQGGANGVGPNLFGVMGGPHGHRPDFAYSEALKGKAGNWNWDEMSQWLRSPRAYAPGTKMTFAGLSDPQDRADVMVYLNAQGSNLPLPAAPAAGPAAPGPAGEAAPGANNVNGNVQGAAPDQPVLNSAQPDTKGGGEASPNNPGGPGRTPAAGGR
jgi:cytochrome c